MQRSQFLLYVVVSFREDVKISGGILPSSLSILTYAYHSYIYIYIVIYTRTRRISLCREEEQRASPFYRHLRFFSSWSSSPRLRSPWPRVPLKLPFTSCTRRSPPSMTSSPTTSAPSPPSSAGPPFPSLLRFFIELMLMLFHAAVASLDRELLSIPCNSSWSSILSAICLLIKPKWKRVSKIGARKIFVQELATIRKLDGSNLLREKVFDFQFVAEI